MKKEAQLPTIIMGYHVPNLHDQDSYVLEVISAVLSSGKSSRLYKNLVREKKVVLSADADNPLLSHDPDLFYISAEPLPGKEVTDVENALQTEIERLKNEPVSERELEKAKNQIEASFIYAQDSLFYQAMMLAHYEINGSWKAIDSYIPSIRKVTADDIQRVAKQYLVDENRTVGILVPLPLKNGQGYAPGGAPMGRSLR